MRGRLAVAIGVVLVCAIVVTAVIQTRRNADARARELLRAALEEGVTRPVAVDVRVTTQMGPSRETGVLAVDYDRRLAYLRMQLSGSSVEMLDDGERLWRVAADGTGVAPLGPSERKIDWPQLLANYEVKAAGHEQIAGVEALKATVTRRRTRTLSEAFWIDSETRLVLRRQTYDADGHDVMFSEVTHILDRPRVDVGERVLKVTAPGHRVGRDESEVPLTDAQCEAQVGFVPHRPTFVPAGYQEIGVYARVCPQGRKYAEIRYFDGLRILSVHEREPGGRGPGYGQGLGRHRRVDPEPVLIDQGQAKTVRYLRHDLRLFVTGDLTPADIIQVVKSIP